MSSYYTPHSKCNKTSTPQSESKSIIVLDDDDQCFEFVIRDSRSPLYLSPLGKKIVKESMKSAKPLNLEDVNKEVLMKEFARQLGQHSDSEEEEDDNKEEEGEEDNDKNSEKKALMKRKAKRRRTAKRSQQLLQKNHLDAQERKKVPTTPTMATTKRMMTTIVV